MKRKSVQAAGAAVLLTVSLTGCSGVQEAADQVGGVADQAESAATQAQDAAEQAGQLWSDAREVSELTVEQVNSFDWSSLEEHWGIYLGNNSEVTQFLRSMPSGPDMESFEIKGEDGTLVVNYGDQAAEADPAVLWETMQSVAAQAKEHVENLKKVEFRVGDEIHTF
ncbi:DUF4825 domain-containing protein [Citricoccus sp.]|uniref:DUF4825 domain-containing protein n=1 Tax=Citricoccus sp. TaxID=1978372 RepID=UPI0028BE557F|nr:DUF4825 domain-containing protein [Citricoccus sp.]